MHIEQFFLQRVEHLGMQDGAKELCCDAESRFLWFLLYATIEQPPELYMKILHVPCATPSSKTVTLVTLQKTLGIDNRSVPFGTRSGLVVAASDQSYVGGIANVRCNEPLHFRQFYSNLVFFDPTAIMFTGSDILNAVRNDWLQKHVHAVRSLVTNYSPKQVVYRLARQIIDQRQMLNNQMIAHLPFWLGK